MTVGVSKFHKVFHFAFDLHYQFDCDLFPLFHWIQNDWFEYVILVMDVVIENILDSDALIDWGFFHDSSPLHYWNYICFSILETYFPVTALRVELVKLIAN